ncbi:unnamed protein product [Phytomonas sp. Hart1]|nr:unnamed protein product [Phytomonas sp. Hart1]|eukprot:CCW68275.1 unnamed protein product [Phytomonas sp. isolate Hart1]
MRNFATLNLTKELCSSRHNTSVIYQLLESNLIYAPRASELVLCVIVIFYLWLVLTKHTTFDDDDLFIPTKHIEGRPVNDIPTIEIKKKLKM